LGREGLFQNDQIACAMPELGMFMDGLPRADNYDRRDFSRVGNLVCVPGGRLSPSVLVPKGGVEI
jgi:hypothetical protein